MLDITDMNCKRKSESDIPDSVYDELILSGVNCSDCNEKLSKLEIVMHKHAGITKQEEMSCHKCWMGVAYDNNENTLMKIIAGRSILENTLTNTIFIASKTEEETQCKGKTREHIMWVGNLDIPVPNVAELMRELYEEIKHGDDEHKQWLKDKIELFITQKCL